MTTEADYFEGLISRFKHLNYWGNLGIKFDYLKEGYARVKLIVTDEVINNNSTLHSGAIASLKDVAISSTLRSLHSNPVTTVSLTTNFIAPAELGKTVYATAKIVSSKKRIHYVESTVVDEGGRRKRKWSTKR